MGNDAISTIFLRCNVLSPAVIMHNSPVRSWSKVLLLVVCTPSRRGGNPACALGPQKTKLLTVDWLAMGRETCIRPKDPLGCVTSIVLGPPGQGLRWNCWPLSLDGLTDSAAEFLAKIELSDEICCASRHHRLRRPMHHIFFLIECLSRGLLAAYATWDMYCLGKGHPCRQLHTQETANDGSYINGIWDRLKQMMTLLLFPELHLPARHSRSLLSMGACLFLLGPGHCRWSSTKRGVARRRLIKPERTANKRASREQPERCWSMAFRHV